MSKEMAYLYGSVLILLGLIVIQAVTSIGNRGLNWGLSNRAEAAPDTLFEARAKRTVSNHIEGLVLFSLAVLCAHAGEISTGLTVLGATLFFWGRLAYAPIYLFGISHLRTLAWAVSFGGTVLILWEIGQAAYAALSV